IRWRSGETVEISRLEVLILAAGDGWSREAFKGVRMKRGDRPRHKKSKASLREAQSRLRARVKEGTAELRFANEGLRREIQRRKGLEGVILEISDREQHRIGQELHDGLCQHLTAVAFMTRAVGLRLQNHRVIEVEDLEKIAELVNQAAINARNMEIGRASCREKSVDV